MHTSNLEMFNNIDVVIAINDIYTISRDFHYCTLRTCPSGHIIPYYGCDNSSRTLKDQLLVLFIQATRLNNT